MQYINGLEYADVTPVFKQDDKSHTVKPQDCFTDWTSGGQAAAVLTEFSKAFDCIDHELLIAKLIFFFSPLISIR